MPSNSGNTHRDFWIKQSQKTSRRVNLAWWLESLAAPLVIVSLVGAAALLWMRRELPVIDPWVLGGSILALVAVLALVCLAFASRKFEKPEQSLVRIEAAMRLRSALTAARAGVTPWPDPVQKTDAGLSWRWPRLLVPLLGALILLAAGMFLPVSAKQAAPSNSPEEPQSWKQLSNELDFLAQEEVVDEPYLEETRKRLEELKAQEEEQWFSHSSLEATDSLKEAHRAETERVERELGEADKALGNLQKNTGSIGQAEKNRLMQEFDQALKGLQNGAMKPNPQLLEQMKNMDLKNLADLDPEQLEQLRKNLQKNADCMKQCQGDGQGEGENWDDELLGEGAEQDPDKPGSGPGKGGVTRGPGHAPGVLGTERDALETGKMTGLEAKDLSHASPGDLLELQDGEHDIDLSKSAMQTGGSTEATGKGGDRVWREALDPDEQRVLKRFFE